MSSQFLICTPSYLDILSPHVYDQQLKSTLEQLQDYPGHYIPIIEDLAAKVHQLSIAQISYALNFILGVAILEKNAPEIITLSDERLRNTRISELCNLSAEPGLVIGSTPDEISKCIAFRVNELLQTYQFDRDIKDTVSFFKEAFVGPPCFNGRFITMERYRCHKQLFISVDEFVREAQKIFPDWTLPFTNHEIDKHAVAMEELFYDFIENHKEIPSIEEFLSYFKTNDFFINLYHQNTALFRQIYQRAVAIYKGY